MVRTKNLVTKTEYIQSLKDEASSYKEEEKDDNRDVVKWIKLLEASKEESRGWRNQCKDANREYESGESEESAKAESPVVGAERFPMYWSDTQTLLPAIYSKSPIIIAKRRLDADDPEGRTGSIIVERLGQYLVDYQPFDSIMETTALEYLNSSRASVRVFFDAKIEKQVVNTPVIQSPEGIFITQDGMPIEDPSLIQQTESGLAIIEEKEVIVDERVFLRSISYTDMLLSSGARTEEEAWFKAFKIPFTKKEAKEKFGDKAKDLKAVESYDSDNKKKKESDFVEVWEIWDKTTKKIYWLSESCKTKFLKEEDDIYELSDFYPDTPLLINSKPKDSLYPTTEYHQTKDCYEHLHKLYQRINRIAAAIRTRFFYDSSVDGLGTLAEQASDGMGVPVTNFADLSAKGGLASVIQFFPINDYVNALNQVIQIFNEQKQALYELRGIPDVVRGVSDPRDLATSQMIKGKWASLRFSRKQKGFQKLVKDAVQKMVDLALAKFQPETIKSIVGFNYLNPEDQARFDSALEMLKNDKQRNIRIDIETDSTVLLNEDEDKAAKLELLEKVGSYMQQTARAIKEEPALAPAMISLLMNTVRGFRQGKDAEDEIQQSFQQLMEQLSQPQEPPPNIDFMKIENEKIKIDNERLKIESDARTKEGELSIKASELKISQFESAVKFQESQFSQQLQTLQFQLEKQNQNLEMYEKLIEEQRLQLQNVLMPEQKELFVQQQNAQSQQVLELLGVVKTLLEENQKPKRVEINRDILGNTKIQILKDLPQLPQ